MDKEDLHVLRLMGEIDRNGNYSQRELSSRLNISLGLVNTFLKRLVTRMDGLLNNVVTEWDIYKTEFIEKTGLDIGSSMGMMVNAYVLEYERYIRSGKVGIPSGSFT